MQTFSHNINVQRFSENILFFPSWQSRDEEYLETLIEQEQYEAALRKKITAEDEKREKTAKRKNKEALIDDLVPSLTYFSRFNDVGHDLYLNFWKEIFLSEFFLH